jgi:hypothetical protein
MVETELAAWIAGAVALAALGIGVAARNALLRTANKNILYVALAFLVFAGKNAVKGIHLTQGPETAPWEIAFSLVDLLAMVLILVPLAQTLRRRSS